MTLSWLFVEQRLVMSTLMAAAAWSWMSLTADSLTRVTVTGNEVDVAAGELTFLCLALAVVSWLALGLHVLGHYPPPEDNPPEVEPNV